MRGMDAASVDAIVTDPPYGLSFMNKAWDHGVPGELFWREALRVAKPGAYLLSFGGSRTYHRLACAVEDAGWEVRDQIMWIYGSGFPKSHNLSGNRKGWGTALKPAHEPIVMARKPFKGTVANNVLTHGTGAINVDGCRVPIDASDAANIQAQVVGFNNTQSIGGNGKYGGGEIIDRGQYDANKGRWPANVIHDGSDEVVSLIPNSAARFFYCPKASKRDRDEGLDHLEGSDKYGPAGQWGSHDCFSGKSGDDAWKAKNPNYPKRNPHPTVKPTDLMRYLCRLVTPPNGTVLDPFAGSGSTGKAARLEGFNFIGIELEPEYAAIAEARLAAV